MIIEEINVVSFGKLHDFSLRPDGSFQIVEGENESGKSTLAAFIRFMLYGFPSREKAASLPEKTKRISWVDGRAAGNMTVSLANGKRYRIERCYLGTSTGHRETFRDTCTVCDLQNNEKVDFDKTPGEALLKVNETVFDNTAFFSDIRRPTVEGGDMADAIQSILFSGDETVNLNNAVDKLTALRRELLHTNAKGGKIYSLKCAKQETEGRLSVAKTQNEALMADEARLEALCEKLRGVEDRENEAARLEKVARARTLAVSFAQLHDAEARFGEAARSLAAIEEEPAFRLTDDDLLELRRKRSMAEGERNDLALLVARTGELHGEDLAEDREAKLALAESRGGVELMTAEAMKSRLRAFLPLPFAAVFAAAAALCALFAPQPFTYFLLGGLGAVALSLGVVSLFGFRKRNRLFRLFEVASHKELTDLFDALHLAKEEKRMLCIQQTELQEKIAAAESAYRNATAELDTVVNRFGARLPKEADRLAAFLDGVEQDARHVMEKKKEYEAKKEAAETQIDHLRNTVAGENEEEVNKTVATNAHLENLPAAAELHRVWEELDNERKSLDDERRTLEGSVAISRAATEDPISLQEELGEIERNLAEEEDRLAACQMALDALQTASSTLRDSVTPRLSEFASIFLQTASEDKYRDLSVDNLMNLSVLADGATRGVDCMSAGTSDLMYLSLRLSLIRLLYKGENPPLCFDESFVHQDDGRASRIIEALMLLGKEGQQSILFSCHSRESNLARAIAPSVAVCSFN